MIYDLKKMRLLPVHLVFGVAVLGVLGALVVAAVCIIPTGEDRSQRVEAGGSRNGGIVERETVAQLVTSDVGRPTKRAS